MVQDIKKKVYGDGKGNLEDQSRVGTVYYKRGVVGILIVEAIRTAQDKYGKEADDRRADALGPREPEPRPKRA